MHLFRRKKLFQASQNFINKLYFVVVGKQCVYAVSHFFSCCRMALQKSGRSVGVREVIYMCGGWRVEGGEGDREMREGREKEWKD